MPKRVLIATEKPFAKVAVEGITAILKEAKYEVIKLESYTDKADLVKAAAACDAMIVRSDLVTDCQLAALAIEHGVPVVSADSDFARFPTLTWINPLAS